MLKTFILQTTVPTQSFILFIYLFTYFFFYFLFFFGGGGGGGGRGGGRLFLSLFID